METVEKIGVERRKILVRGIVQGVGFRPFVYREAKRLDLKGWVLNDSSGVIIEVEGEPRQIEGLLYSLRANSPTLAQIERIDCEPAEPLGEQETDFVIKTSKKAAERHVSISPDSSICPDCLQELFDPKDRRYNYPFINCTNCGPRFTIVKDVPYDRQSTTMSVFAMCLQCLNEYTNPIDRRYYAQPNACPECGPEVFLINKKNQKFSIDDVVRVAVQKLARGQILAIKGLGGYHLACDALNENAVRTLRQRKERDAKPFALMVPDLKTAAMLCEIDEAETRLLESVQRPIVLLKKKNDCPVVSQVALNYGTLGLMLPYTPLHFLLLHKFAEATGLEQPAALVMTSGNVSEEPIAFRDTDAPKKLFPIADAMLSHNREIHMRCDDSVVQATVDGPQILRRSRGYVPEPIATQFKFPLPILAVGGHLKNTFCLAKGNHAFVSPHIGDLENIETFTAFCDGIAHFKKLFDIHPEIVAHDLHPEYLSTKFALESDIPAKIAIQHHHAHIASVLAEHVLEGPVIGISADGTGYGTDGAVWGCEIMLATLSDFERIAHLDYVPMPGGGQAIRQPWRMAAVYLRRSFGDSFLDLDLPFVKKLQLSKWQPLLQMIEKNINCPKTSSLGRLFDAVAAILNLRSEVQYEGQAAIELEMVAHKSNKSYAFEFTGKETATLDVTPMIREIVVDMQNRLPVAEIAGKFHAAVANFLAESCLRARNETGLSEVALSGGVFQNLLLSRQLLVRLKENGFKTYINQKLPPNDGGLSLGQAAVAALQQGDIKCV